MTFRLLLAAAFAAAVTAASAADHLDSPRTERDPRLDINDLYVFRSPQTPENAVFVMTVNPAAGMIGSETFHPQADYEFNIDTDGDAIADLTYTAFFSRVRVSDGRQLAAVRTRNRTLGTTTVGFGTAIRGGGKFRAATQEDPFFFDLEGFQDGFNFTGEDFFAGLNVSAIVLEVPIESLGGQQIGVWARTVINGNQFDRIGRPAINTAVTPGPLKNLYNVTQPFDDARRYTGPFVETITALSGDAEYARTVAGVLLPDVLTVDFSQPVDYLNGRGLADDVIDVSLGVLTNGGLESDGVDGNDSAFRDVFPYLARPFR